MKTLGQVLTEARKRAGLTQREVASRLRREDGRPVDPPYLNAVEHDHRYPPEDHLIEQLAKILGISADVLYFHANRQPADVKNRRGPSTGGGCLPCLPQGIGSKVGRQRK